MYIKLITDIQSKWWEGECEARGRKITSVGREEWSLREKSSEVQIKWWVGESEARASTIIRVGREEWSVQEKPSKIQSKWWKGEVKHYRARCHVMGERGEVFRKSLPPIQIPCQPLAFISILHPNPPTTSKERAFVQLFTANILLKIFGQSKIS